MDGLGYSDPDIRSVLGSFGAQCLSARAFRLLACLLLGVEAPPGTSTATTREELKASGLLPTASSPRFTEEEDLTPDDNDLRTRQGRRVPTAWRKRFDIFWDRFGYKSGRVGALTAWCRLEQAGRYTAIDYDHIYSAAERESRRAAMAPNRIRMMAEGWLNDHRWEDHVQLVYTTDGEALLRAFNHHCPRAQKVSEFTPARLALINAALQRRPLAAWDNYFKFLRDHPDLLAFAQPAVSLQLALSIEVDCKVQEYRNRSIKAVKRLSAESPI